MNDQATETCPDCQGRKGGIVMLGGDGCPPWREFTCYLCAATGVVPVERAEKWRERERERIIRPAEPKP